MDKIQSDLKELLLSSGASDAGFAYIENSPCGYNYALSLCVRLSESIIDEIEDEPTHTYFNHYRSVNTFIDQLLLKAGLFLQSKGYHYITIPASQSVNKDGWNYAGRFSHKEVARKAGLGSVGKNSLFIHKEYGPMVRLGSLFTDFPFTTGAAVENCLCGECRRCVDACPAGAITGAIWYEGIEREKMFLPDKCSEYMKTQFKHIGRGAVCGICIKVCPKSGLIK